MKRKQYTKNGEPIRLYQRIKRGINLCLNMIKITILLLIIYVMAKIKGELDKESYILETKIKDSQQLLSKLLGK